MTAYHGRAPIVRAGRPWLSVALAAVVAVVLAIGIELSLLYPYLNR